MHQSRFDYNTFDTVGRQLLLYYTQGRSIGEDNGINALLWDV